MSIYTGIGLIFLKLSQWASTDSTYCKVVSYPNPRPSTLPKLIEKFELPPPSSIFRNYILTWISTVQLIRAISTVVVTVTDPTAGSTPTTHTCELFLLTRWYCWGSPCSSPFPLSRVFFRRRHCLRWSIVWFSLCI